MEKEDIVLAFEYFTRNRYFKLFDYYQAWFVDKEFLSVEISRKIKADLGIQISQSSIHYIRSKIMPKRLAEKVKKVPNVESCEKIEIESNIHNNFKFNEPQSIDHNQEIVTFRKRKI